jgi:hypothetical protein
MVNPVGRGIGPSQGLYLHSTALAEKLETYVRSLSGIRIHDPRDGAVQNRRRNTGNCLCIYILFRSTSESSQQVNPTVVRCL